MSILEAARWAPSAFNGQPWRFVYARRDTPSWEGFVDLLVPRNRDWAQHASALVFIASKTTILPHGADHPAPSSSHTLVAGASSAYLGLQAHLMGWCVHGMAGFDRDRAATELRLPHDHVIQAVYAIGRKGDATSLPGPLRARERPSSRMPLSEIAFEGAFRQDS